MAPGGLVFAVRRQKVPRVLLHLIITEEALAYRHSLRARLKQRTHIIALYATYGDDGQRKFGCGLPQNLRIRGGGQGFSAGCEKPAESKITSPFRDGPPGQFQAGVAGDADNCFIAQSSARFGHRTIRLTQMHPVGSGRQSHLYPIINDAFRTK